MKDAGASTDGVTIAEVRQHKVDVHLAEALEAFLLRHPGEVSRSYATTQALQATFDANCDFELELFHGDHELRDRIYALIRQSRLDRLPRELSESIYETCHPLWRRHSARMSEREEAKSKKEERLRYERAEQRNAAALKIIEAERSKAERQNFIASAEQLFRDDYLAFEKLVIPSDLEGLSVEIESLRHAGVANWLKEYAPTITLEPQQLDAICAVQGDTLVTARAGSGKTSVLVFRALFMLTHCKIPAKEILLVAFNRAAAKEIRHRLTELLKKKPEFNLTLPEIRTFHSIAYRLNEGNRNRLSLPPINEYLKDDDEQDGAKSRVIRAVLKSHLSEAGNRKRMQKLMLRHFESDWIAILRPQSVVEYLHALDWDSVSRQAMDGTFVKSRGERMISDTLFRYGVEYRYENVVRISDLRNVRPDFTISTPSGDQIVIEFFGIVGDAKYESDKRKKLEAFRVAGIPVLQLFPKDLVTADLMVNSIISFLTTHLNPDKDLSPLPEEALIRKMQTQSKTRFESLVKTFIERCRVEGLAPADVEEYLSRAVVRDVLDRIELDFYAMAVPLYKEYLDFLKRENLEDFEGLLLEAVHALDGGHTLYASDDDNGFDLRDVRFISIDEFQDFSAAFQKLVDSILGLTDAEIFAVGDDWQSINSYMGAIPDIFQKFETQRPQLKKIVIPFNHRSTRNIVEFGNAVMSSASVGVKARSRVAVDGKPVRFVDISLIKHNSSEGERKLWELAKNRGVALLRICEEAANAGLTVAVLSRFRANPTDIEDYAIPSKSESKLKYLAGQITKYSALSPATEGLTESTTHSFKGKERDVVVVWDSDMNRYPYINPDWIFSRIFGLTLHRLLEEEQRLAYVAVTRARRGLILLAEGKPSPIFSGLMIAYQPRSNLISEEISNNKFRIRVQDGFDSKVVLKNAGFRWIPSAKTWEKIENFNNSLDQEAQSIRENQPDWYVHVLASAYRVTLSTADASLDL